MSSFSVLGLPRGVAEGRCMYICCPDFGGFHSQCPMPQGGQYCNSVVPGFAIAGKSYTCEKHNVTRFIVLADMSHTHANLHSRYACVLCGVTSINDKKGTITINGLIGGDTTRDDNQRVKRTSVEGVASCHGVLGRRILPNNAKVGNLTIDGIEQWIVYCAERKKYVIIPAVADRHFQCECHFSEGTDFPFFIPV